MKKGILFTAVILLSTVSFAQTQEGELSGTLDATYLSAYMWRGFDQFLGAHGEGAIRPGIDLDLYGTGLGLNVLWYRANTSGFENLEEIDLTLSYSSRLFEYETYATDFMVGWVYYGYPDQPRGGSTTSTARDRSTSDLQEAFAVLSWPEICPEGVIPSYTAIRIWPSESGSALSRLLSDNGGAGGWIHVLGLNYDLPVEGFLPDTPEQILHLSATVTYNDGVLGVDSDWSHAVFGVSTDFDLGNDLSFVPGLYYQKSLDYWDSTSGDLFNDVLWCSMSVRYSF